MGKEARVEEEERRKRRRVWQPQTGTETESEGYMEGWDSGGERRQTWRGRWWFRGNNGDRGSRDTSARGDGRANTVRGNSGDHGGTGNGCADSGRTRGNSGDPGTRDGTVDNVCVGGTGGRGTGERTRTTWRVEETQCGSEASGLGGGAVCDRWGWS